MGFVLGILAAVIVIVFASDIQSVMVASGMRDSIVIWLNGWV